MARNIPFFIQDPFVLSAMEKCKKPFFAVFLLSFFINVFMLSGSIYMLQVYDRVLTSHSLQTLAGLSILLIAAYVTQGILEAIRGQMLARIGLLFDEVVSPQAFYSFQIIQLSGAREQTKDPLRDLEQIRNFLGSLGPTVIFDLPWTPIFFVGCFILHPWLGVLAVTGSIVIILIAVIMEHLNKNSLVTHFKSGLARQKLVSENSRFPETIMALGMSANMRTKWVKANRAHVIDGITLVDSSSSVGAFAKMFRMALQSGVLGVGAYLVIRGEMSGGAMIAASIMTSRALAPIELGLVNAKNFKATIESFQQLAISLRNTIPSTPAQIELRSPCKTFSVENLSVARPGSNEPIVRGISFSVSAGEGMGVIGPSASGKSTLAKALVGIWKPLHGSLRLDGAAFEQYDLERLHRHIGYLPQSIEFFSGTIGENISRFDQIKNDDEVIKAAQNAGVHELIVRMKDGYNTIIGDPVTQLSGGQRQRIALARALYRDPFVVVLDEPNSNLDNDGETALIAAIRGVRNRGGIVIIVTHRPSAIVGVDLLAVIEDGALRAIGPKQEVIERLRQSAVSHGGLQGTVK